MYLYVDLINYQNKFPDNHSRLRRLRGILKNKKIAVSSAIATVSIVSSALFGGAIPARATTCAYGTLFASLGSGVLYKYQSDGTQIGSGVQLAQTYFDLAFDSSNGTFYGIRSNGQIDVVNVDTGSIIRSFQARAGFYNSGSVLPGGMIAAANGSSVVYINPSDGTTTDYFDMNAIQDENGQTYTNWSSAGDFITLTDGSLILLLSNNTVPVTTAGTIVVKVSNGVGRILGTVPGSWGGARVGSDLFVAGADGQMRKITSLPSTPGRGVIATTTVATSQSGGFYGAAGTEDSEAATCSTSGTNGFTPGTDAFSAAVAATPAVAGTAPVSTPVSSPTPSSSSAPSSTSTVASLAQTGPANTVWYLFAGATALVAGLGFMGYKKKKH